MSLTLLNEDLDNSETGVDVTPALTDANRPALVLVGNEIMSVTSGTGTLTVVRGADGTEPAAHANTTPVYEIVSVQFRADSILVYYIADDGAMAVKSIIIEGDSTAGVPSTVNASAGDKLTVNSDGSFGWVTGQGSVKAIEGHITEANAGTYTISVPVKANSRLLDILWYTDTAFSAATSATLKAGHSGGTDNAFITAANVKAQAAGNSHAVTGAGWGTSNEGVLAGAKAGFFFTADDTINVTVVTVGAGTTGRFRAVVLVTEATTPIEATKS